MGMQLAAIALLVLSAAAIGASASAASAECVHPRGSVGVGAIHPVYRTCNYSRHAVRRVKTAPTHAQKMPSP